MLGHAAPKGMARFAAGRSETGFDRKPLTLTLSPDETTTARRSLHRGRRNKHEHRRFTNADHESLLTSRSPFVEHGLDTSGVEVAGDFVVLIGHQILHRQVL